MTPITPHPLATWVQMQVSPQRHQARRRRRLRVARIVAARERARLSAEQARPQPRPATPAGPAPSIPAQRVPQDTPAAAPDRVRRPSQARA
jgi:hypothetical protein